MEYIMTFDYHTHTDFSHGKGTIRENVLAARSKGLKEIAITDHGPGHMEHGLNISRVPEMREIIDGLNKEFSDIRVHLGIEANIIDKGNNLDISPEEIPMFDMVIAGYHHGLADARCPENYADFYKNYRSRDLMLKNTEMAVKAICENNIRILTHPGDRAHFDMKELAKACKANDTWVEVSTQHPNPNYIQLATFAEEDVKFVISSDAHYPDRVGRFLPALKKALDAGITLDRIVNIEEKK